MNNSIVKLLFFELRKFWSLSTIIISSVIFLLILAGTLVPAFIGVYGSKALIPNIDYNITIYSFYKILVPLLSLFFTVGIVSFDKRSHWLRTILSRQISREYFLLIKMLAALISIFFLMILMGILPISILVLIVSVPIKFSLSYFIYINLLYLFEASLYIAISTWLSCFLPSFLNLVVLAFWMFTDAYVLRNIVDFFLWDKTWAVILNDFYFPSGFSDAVGKILTNSKFPLNELLWGITSLFGFLSLTLYHFNKIQIDSGSD
jgi:ABC-type transport system involved in multi-copper enzyme maturation permease subunit